MVDDLTAIQREKINREARQGLICTNGMGERTVNGKDSSSEAPIGNLVLEDTQGGSDRKQSKSRNNSGR